MMAKRAVVLDTSVLSAFAKIGRLHLLKTILEGYRVLIPDSVYRELSLPSPSDDPKGEEHETIIGTWMQIEPVEDTAKKHSRLGRGEAGVLQLAKQHNAIAVLDDLAARKQAKREDILVSGTLGLLKKAAAKGVIDKKVLKAILTDLERKDSFYLSEDVKSSLLR